MIREELGDIGLTLWASEVSIINIGGWTGHNLGQKFQWNNNISATKFLTKASMMVVMFVYNFYKTLTFWSCSIIILCFFMFWKERDIKESKNAYLAPFLT